jgi:hypothetical protein
MDEWAMECCCEVTVSLGRARIRMLFLASRASISIIIDLNSFCSSKHKHEKSFL